MAGKIFVVMGTSPHEEKTVFESLREMQGFRENTEFLIPYTTRPERKDEINGVDYNFVENNYINLYRANRKIISCTRCEFEGKPVYYALLDRGFNPHMNYVIKGSLPIYRDVIEYFKDSEMTICPIFIETPDNVILKTPIYAESERVADEEEFRHLIPKKKYINNFCIINTTFTIANDVQKSIDEDVNLWI